MDYYIFRKADSALLYVSYSEAQYTNEKAACLRNEGGVEADYIYVTSETSRPPGMVAVLSASNEVEFQANPVLEAKRVAKEGLDVKLRALGLNDADLSALG
jgi:hypothetical protein